MLHVQLFGGFHLTYAGATLRVGSTRLQSVLAYMVLHADLPQARQHLAYSFWPDSTEAQAFTNLRKVIYQLRQLLPQPDTFLYADQYALQWRQDAPYSADVDELAHLLQCVGESNCDLSNANRILDLYRGELLPNCYEDWIVPIRQHYHQAVRQVLTQLITMLENQRAYEEGIRYAHRLLALDPLDETAYCHLMRLQARKGDRSGALQVYRECTNILQQELGVDPSPQTQQIYAHVLASLPATHASTPAEAEPVSLALVGRSSEWTELQAVWRRACQEHAQLLVISGEAGIGKTRLAEELLAWVRYQGVVVARTRSYASQGALAYAPVVELLRSPNLSAQCAELGAVWRTEIARLMPELLEADPQLAPPAPLRDRLQRRRFWEALALAVRGKRELPLLLLFDDLQWCDEETLMWLAYLLQSAPQAQILMLATVRDDELAPDHPFHTLYMDLLRTDQVQQISLSPLSATETEELASQLTSAPITTTQADQLFCETEGNPLFVEESVRARAEDVTATDAGQVAQEAAANPPTPLLNLPPKVHAVISHRLRQLSSEAQIVAELAAVIGRAFSVDLLVATGVADEGVVVDAVDELWQRRILREHPGGYDFSHDRIRDVAYHEIGKARQHLLHRQIAAALETFPLGPSDEVIGLVAVHYDRAGLASQAIAAYRRAAELATARHAFGDAVRFLRAALVLVPSLPESSEKPVRELALQTDLVDIFGYSMGRADELEQRALRALELLDPVEDRPRQRRLLAQLSYFYYGRAMFQRAIAVGEQQVAEGEATEDPLLVFNGHTALASSYYHLGELQASIDHHARAIFVHELHQENIPQDVIRTGFRTSADARSSEVLWFLGHVDQALRRAQEALALAREYEYPPRITFCLFSLARVYMFRREVALSQDYSERLVDYAERYGFPQRIAHGTYLLGWAKAVQGECEGIVQMEQGLAGWLATGTCKHQPGMLIGMAEAYGLCGDAATGLERLTQAETIILDTHERVCEAELYRVRGELLRVHSPANIEQIQNCFHQALALARSQQAKSLELRAALSLARLWHEQRQHSEAYELLFPVYNWFSEGFDISNLCEARALLDQLSA